MSSPPPRWQDAPDVLATEMLADVLTRNPARIQPALAKAKLSHFYPTFLNYLVDSIVEMAGPPRLRPWKRLAANEHVSLLADRRDTVARMLIDVKRSLAARHRGASSQPRGDEGAGTSSIPPAEGAVRASRVAAGQVRERAQQVKESCERAASYVRAKSGLSEESQEIGRLLDSPDAKAFLIDLKMQLLASPDLVRRFADATAVAVPFGMAFDAELREIEQSRARRLPASPPAPDVAAVPS